MMSPAHVPRTGVPDAASARSGSASPSRSIPSVIVVDSPPGMIEPVQPVQIGRHAHLAHLRAERAQHPLVRREAALERKHSDRHAAYQPR